MIQKTTSFGPPKRTPFGTQTDRLAYPNGDPNPGVRLAHPNDPVWVAHLGTRIRGDVWVTQTPPYGSPGTDRLAHPNGDPIPGSV